MADKFDMLLMARRSCRGYGLCRLMETELFASSAAKKFEIQMCPRFAAKLMTLTAWWEPAVRPEHRSDSESATRQAIPRSESIVSEKPINCSRKQTPGANNGHPSRSC